MHLEPGAGAGGEADAAAGVASGAAVPPECRPKGSAEVAEMLRAALAACEDGADAAALRRQLLAVLLRLDS